MKLFPNFTRHHLIIHTYSLKILVPLWFIIISLVFCYLSEELFSGFLQFQGNFVDGENNSKHHDVAPLI